MCKAKDKGFDKTSREVLIVLKYNAYHIEDGATYVICARNARQAVDVYFRTLEGAGGLKDIEDEGSGFEISRMPEKETKDYTVTLEDGGTTTVWDEIKDATQPFLVGGSEV
ncbi:MAG: hypothetical protein MJA83_16710 [Gammaproteobacteria bacterium]|nr:hypothetical protein [Gammaproteobacteria bacterium]